MKQSLDKTEESFQEYFDKQAWPFALPHGSELVKQLSAKYKVQGIPTLVLLETATGKLITVHVLYFINLPCLPLTHTVGEDADGSAFPYRPRSVWELLEEAGHVIDAKDTKFDVSFVVNGASEFGSADMLICSKTYCHRYHPSEPLTV